MTPRGGSPGSAGLCAAAPGGVNQPSPGTALPCSIRHPPGQGSAEPRAAPAPGSPGSPPRALPAREERAGLTAAGLPAPARNPGCCGEGAALCGGKVSAGAGTCLTAITVQKGSLTSLGRGAGGGSSPARKGLLPASAPLQEPSCIPEHLGITTAAAAHPRLTAGLHPTLGPGSGTAFSADLGQSLAGRQRQHIPGSASRHPSLPPGGGEPPGPYPAPSCTPRSPRWR